MVGWPTDSRDWGRMARTFRVCASLTSVVVASMALVGAVSPSGAPGATMVRARPSVSATPWVTVAHLRITLTTTSDWAQVRLTPGRVVAAHRSRVAGRGSARALADGVGLTRVRGTARVTTDLVLTQTTGVSSFALTMAKGYIGAARVRVTNLNGSSPVPVASVADVVHNPHDASNGRVITLSRARLFGGTPLALPHADNRKLVLAFYYPWFADYTKSTLADVPMQGRSVWDPAGVGSMTQQAKQNGVNGFIVSWHGNADGSAFDLALRAAERQGQVVAPYVETPSATSQRSPEYADPFTVYVWLKQALARRTSSAFLKASDGVPVVFVYEMEALKPGQWAGVVGALAKDGVRVHLVGDETDARYLPFEWGVHRYSALDGSASLTAWSRNTSLVARAGAVVDPSRLPRLYAGTVSPGFDDQALRGELHPVVARGDGSRYDATWSAALAGDPDWVLVSTWNEWFEDSQIEPGLLTGSTALRQTAIHARNWRGTPG